MAKVVTNLKQIGKRPELRNKIVDMPGYTTVNGDDLQFCVWELTQRDFYEMQRESAGDRTQAENDVLFLAHTIRDQAQPAGNRIFHDYKQAEETLGLFPWADVQRLVAAANEVNGDRETPADAEGNSETKSTSDTNSA